MRTARANGIPHSTLRAGRLPAEGWTVKDRLLAVALTEYEDGLCGGCGQPKDRSWNGDLEGYYEAHRATCLACEAARLDVDANGEVKGSQTVYVTEHPDAPAVPDPRMMAGG